MAKRLRIFAGCLQRGAMSAKQTQKPRNRPSAKLRRVVYLPSEYADMIEGVDLSALLRCAVSELPLHRFPKGSRKNRRKSAPDIDAIPADYLSTKGGK